MIDMALPILDFIFEKVRLDITDVGLAFLIWKDMRYMLKKDLLREAIDKRFQKLEEGDKNLDRKRFERIAKIALKKAIGGVGIGVRLIQHNTALKQNREVAKTRLIAVFKREFNDLLGLGGIILWQDVPFQKFVQSFREKWIAEQEYVLRSLNQHWDGQPSDIANVEQHLDDLFMLLDDAFDMWLDTGKDYQEQRSAK